MENWAVKGKADVAVRGRSKKVLGGGGTKNQRAV